MISLGGGMPNPALFPFAEVRVTMKDGYEWTLSSHDSEAMIDAFQYTGTAGIAPLLTELRQLQIREHHPQLPDNVPLHTHTPTHHPAPLPPHPLLRPPSLLSPPSPLPLPLPLPLSPQAWSVAVTNGSQDGLAKMAEALLAPHDTVLCETPTYSGALSIFRPLRANIVGLQCDAHGVIPQAMEAVLEGWDVAKAGRFPKLLYVIPVGQNPAGSSMPEGRRREVLALASRFDLLVLEDDPYYFLDYGEAKAPADAADFHRPCVPSMWAMDREGRVIRFDSLSKVFSSGLRLGYVTGPVQLMNAMLLNVQATNLHSTGIAQLMAARFLHHLGEAGWRRHVDMVSLFYLRRRDLLLSYVDKYLDGLVSYTVPCAGMFVWFKLLHVRDSKKLIEGSARKALVLLVPGQVFMPDNAPSSYVRASFSLATEADMEVAIQRLAHVLREEREEGAANGETHNNGVTHA